MNGNVEKQKKISISDNKCTVCTKVVFAVWRKKPTKKNLWKEKKKIPRQKKRETFPWSRQKKTKNHNHVNTHTHTSFMKNENETTNNNDEQ